MPPPTGSYGTGLSTLDIVAMAFAIGRTLLFGLYTFILSPFRGSSGAKSITKHVKLAMARKLLECLTVAQSQAIVPPIESTYPAYAKKRGFKPESVTMGGGTKAVWIGDPKSEKVILWFHGGGYTLAADVGHFEFASTIVDSAQAAGKQLAILFPAYTLAPYATYPRQLEQGVEGLKFVLEDLGRKPGNVILAGDSAGANLALALLSHTLHPHPSGTVPPLSLPLPLNGAIFLAPWFSFSAEWPSMSRNRHKDSVSPALMDIFTSNFLGGKPKDEYNEPVRAPQEWWDGLGGLVEGVLVVGARDEMLVDGVGVMIRRLEEAHPETTALLVEDEFHDQPINSIIGYVGQGQQADGVRAWVNGRF